MSVNFKNIIPLFIGLALLGFDSQYLNAYAGQARNTPSIATFSSPFNGAEYHSTDISHFTKWTSVLTRMKSNPKTPRPWSENKSQLQNLGRAEMAQRVNDLVNKYTYTTDQITYGKSDYWATPAEFFLNGGDCEDFALAKYGWLRFLGVPDEQMRIAIVHDRIKSTPHAILLIYINGKSMILDSQIKDIRESNYSNRYRLIYSINRSGWWLPAKTKNLVLSMVGSISSTEPASGENDFKFSADCFENASRLPCLNTIEPSAQ